MTTRRYLAILGVWLITTATVISLAISTPRESADGPPSGHVTPAPSLRVSQPTPGAPSSRPILVARPATTAEGLDRIPSGPTHRTTDGTPRMTGTRVTGQVESPHPSSISGTATWYATGPAGEAAAGPALRAWLGPHWRGTWVWVTANGSSVRVVLGDWCACRGRLIDLPAGVFRRLAPLSRGILTVTVSRAGPLPTPPVTSTAP